MSTLLHLDSAAWGRKVNFTQYAAVAAELLHASRDAIEAITSFQELAFHAAGSAALPKASWLDFDAHPGDCACQIRPAGLHLLVCAFRSDPHKTKAKLQGTLDRLLEVATVAKETFHQLCTLNLNVAKIGAGLDRKSMILEDFCYAIGAGTWFDQICQPDLWLAASLPNPCVGPLSAKTMQHIYRLLQMTRRHTRSALGPCTRAVTTSLQSMTMPARLLRHQRRRHDRSPHRYRLPARSKEEKAPPAWQHQPLPPTQSPLRSTRQRSSSRGCDSRSRTGTLW